MPLARVASATDIAGCSFSARTPSGWGPACSCCPIMESDGRVRENGDDVESAHESALAGVKIAVADRRSTHDDEKRGMRKDEGSGANISSLELTE